MKKYLVLLIVFVLLGYFSPATATETFTPQTADGLQYKAGAKAGYTTSGENKMQVQKSTEEIRTLRDEAQMKMDKLKNLSTNLKDKVRAVEQQNRLLGRENALARFDNIINTVESAKNRVLSQIPKLKAIGVETTSAESQLVEVQNKLDKAKGVIAEAHNIFASSADELTKSQKDDLKNKAKEAQALIKEAHESLTNIVKSLRDAVKAKKSNSNPVAPTNGAGNVGTDGATPTYACSYAPAPDGCTYVKGPNYNETNSCGMVLSCPNQSNQ